MRPASGRPHEDPVDAIDALLAPAGAAPLWVGFSGGLDSSVLLHATCAARAARGEPAPHAIHVHHGLQPDADAWALHCTNEALRWGVTLRVSRVRVADAGSLEATARDARYALFRELLATPDAALLLAHHRDDQVETVLLRLLQGRGLYGMPRVRPLGRGRVLRPLLGMARADLIAYARQHQLAWVDDPSNAMLAADRNFLRQSVLPLLRTRFPELDARVLAVAAAAGAAR
ncbi:MAG: tRNA lysidine(34) synthetase TilS, partial [Gammaproteobacteria bacterium]